MKKKTTLILGAGLAACLLLAGCGDDDTYEGLDSQPTKEEIETITGGVNTDVAISPQVIYEEGDVSIEVSALYFDAEEDPSEMTLTLTIEGADPTDVSLSGLAINGYMIEASDYDAESSSISVDPGELQLYGISTITEIDVALCVNGHQGDVAVMSTGEDPDTSIADTYLAAIQTSSLLTGWGDRLQGLETGCTETAGDLAADSAAILTDRWNDRVALAEVENTGDSTLTATLSGFGVNGTKVTDYAYEATSMEVFAGCRAVFEVDPSTVVSDKLYSSLGLTDDSLAAFSFEFTTQDGDVLTFDTKLSDAGTTSVDVIGISAIEQDGLTLTAVSDPTPTEVIYFYAENDSDRALTIGPDAACTVGGDEISCTGGMSLRPGETGIFALTTENFNISDYILNNAEEAEDAAFAAMDFVMPVTDEDGNETDLSFTIDYNSEENSVRIRPGQESTEE